MQKRISIYLACIILICLNSCEGQAQPDLAKLTDKQWKEDLAYMVDRIDKSFPRFTPEIRTQFDAEKGRLLNELEALPVPEKILAMAKLLAILHDGHTELPVVNESAGFGRYPFILYYFGDALYVIATNEENKDMIGSTVEAFDGMPVQKVFDSMIPYVNRDNDVELVTTIPEFMQLPEMLFALKISQSMDKVTLTTKKDGMTSDHLVQSITRKAFDGMNRVRAFEKAPLYLESANEVNWFRSLPEHGILYINIRSLYNQDGETPVKKFLKSAMDEFDKSNSQRLVIDVRTNRGGNYHNAEPLLDGISKRPVLHKKNAVIVINGRLTFSAASVATIFLKDQANALIVGEVSRTRPNWSENNETYYMPNSKIKFDCLDEIKIHSPRLGNSAIIPVDVEIKKTFETYKAGRDEVMEYIFTLPK